MTSMLWLFIAVFTILAMLFLLVPVLRYRQGARVLPLEARKQKNREVFAQRQLELEKEAADGLIAQEDMQQLKTEAQRAFMKDMEALEQEQGSSERSPAGKLVPFLFIVLVPLLSLVLYQQQGASSDLALPDLLSRISASEDAQEQETLLNELADELQTRFDRNADDLQNAYMLGTLYEELARFDEAAATFRRMLEQMEPSPDKATVYGQLSRTLYQREESKLTDEVQSAVDAALALNPNEFSVMAILANDAFVREDLPAALGYWRRQLSSATPGSQQADSLRQVIAMVESYLPEQEQQGSAAVSGATVVVTVDIDPALVGHLKDGQHLFIFVRNPAMPQPILAQNLDHVPEFPFTITMDNSMSMLGTTLESAPTLVAGARISATGATAQSGDLQTLSAPFVLGELAGPVMLTIDQVAP